MLRAKEAGSSGTRRWSHCLGSYMPSWKTRNYYCLCPIFYMVLGKLLKPIFSQAAVDFWFAFSACPIRKCPSDSGLICEVLSIATKDCGCCAFHVWSVCISATKTNTTKNGLKISWFWLSKSVNDYDLDLFSFYLWDSFTPLCFIIYSDKSLFVKY